MSNPIRNGVIVLLGAYLMNGGSDAIQDAEIEARWTEWLRVHYEALPDDVSAVSMVDALLVIADKEISS